jgi:hypothetical protein
MIRLLRGGGVVARPREPERPPEEPVPLFRTWPAAYASVVVWTLLTLLALYYFQEWMS